MSETGTAGNGHGHVGEPPGAGSVSRAGPARFAFALALALGACRTASQRDSAVTLRFWGLGREGEVVAQLAPEFERENRGIRVQVQQIPWTAAHEKLLTAYVGDATPDLAQIGNTWVAEFATLHAVRPLDRLAATSRFARRAAFFPGAWRGNEVNGEAYGLPWYVDTRVIFYRPDLLKRAGYDSIPGSWSGWLQAMQRVKEVVGPRNYAILLPTTEWAPPVVLALQDGSTLLKDGGRWGAFQEPAFRRAFDFYIDLYRRGLAPPVASSAVANLYQEFARGSFAMTITGPWQLGEFARRLPPGTPWATAPMPGPDGERSRTSMAGGSSLVIFRGTAHEREAWHFLEYLSRPDVQLRFYRLTGDLPAVAEAWRDSSLIGGGQARAFREQLQRMEPLPAVPEIEDICIRVQDATESVVRGGASVDAALARLDRDVNDILAKRRWLLAQDSARTAAARATPPGARPAGGGGAR